jgi:hypothetical protein
MKILLHNLEGSVLIVYKSDGNLVRKKYLGWCVLLSSCWKKSQQDIKQTPILIVNDLTDCKEWRYLMQFPHHFTFTILWLVGNTKQIELSLTHEYMYVDNTIAHEGLQNLDLC